MRRFAALTLVALLCTMCALPPASADEAYVMPKWKKMDMLIERLDALDANASVDLTAVGMKLSDCDALRERYPGMRFVFKLNVLGKYTRSDATSLNLGTRKFKDANDLFDYLEWMPELQSLRVRGHVFTYDERSALERRFPNITDVECLLKVGNRTLLSTCTAYCTKHALYTTDRQTQDDFRILKYCPNLKALDIGHNSVSDLSFLSELPPLQILILADNDVTDLSPLKSQPELEYIELFLNEGITDLSPLADRPKLLDLHVGCCAISDFSPLLSDTGLDRLWIGGNPVTDEQIAMLKEGLPNCTINWTAIQHPTAEGWRQGHPRYLKIAEMFGKGKYIPFP